MGIWQGKDYYYFSSVQYAPYKLMWVPYSPKFRGRKISRISLVREWLRKISPTKFQVQNRCKVWLEARSWKFIREICFWAESGKTTKYLTLENFRLITVYCTTLSPYQYVFISVCVCTCTCVYIVLCVHVCICVLRRLSLLLVHHWTSFELVSGKKTKLSIRTRTATMIQTLMMTFSQTERELVSTV